MPERKRYTKEFKLDAVSLVLDQGHSRTDVAKMLDVNNQMISRWVKEYQQDDDGQAFRGNGKLTPEQEEIRRLKVQVKQLEMEKRILKEATVFSPRKPSKISVYRATEKDLPSRFDVSTVGREKKWFLSVSQQSESAADTLSRC